MVTNVEDAGIERRRDAELTQASEAQARAGAAEAAGDHDAAQAFRHRAAEHVGHARVLDEQLRAGQERRRVELALALRQHQTAATREVSR